MATLYSDQIQKAVNAGNSLINGFTERGCYGRKEFFTRNTTNAAYGAPANGDTIVLARLPKGAVILGGTFSQGGLGTSVVATITVGSQALATASASVASAGQIALAPTNALGYGYTLTADSDVTVVLSGATPASAVQINGHIEYIWN